LIPLFFLKFPEVLQKNQFQFDHVCKSLLKVSAFAYSIIMVDFVF